MIKLLTAAEIKAAFDEKEKDFFSDDFYHWLANSGYWKAQILDADAIFKKYKEYKKDSCLLEAAYGGGCDSSGYWDYRSDAEAAAAVFEKLKKNPDYFTKELPGSYVVSFVKYRKKSV